MAPAHGGGSECLPTVTVRPGHHSPTPHRDCRTQKKKIKNKKIIKNYNKKKNHYRIPPFCTNMNNFSSTSLQEYRMQECCKIKTPQCEELQNRVHFLVIIVICSKEHPTKFPPQKKNKNKINYRTHKECSYNSHRKHIVWLQGVVP